jgi:hypothetical protein
MSNGSVFTCFVSLGIGVGTEGPATWDCATGGVELGGTLEASTFGGKDGKPELTVGTAAIPLPLITTVIAAPGVPTADVAISPAVVRVAESIEGGGDVDSGCAWFGTPEPPASTVTALATVDRVEPADEIVGIAPMLIVWSWKGCAWGGCMGKEPAPHLQTHWLQIAFPPDWAVALLAPPPATTVTAEPGAETLAVAMRPSFVRVAELMDGGADDGGACWTFAGGAPPALTAMAEPGGGIEVVAISPSLVRVAELMAAGPTEVPAAAACPPPAWTVTAEPGAGSDVVAIRPSFVRVAELTDAAGGAEDAACALAGGFPPALTTMAEPGADIEVVAIRPSLVKVPLDAPTAAGCPPAITPTVDAVPFPPPAITPTALAALLVVVAPTSPSLVKVVPAAATVVFPPEPT